MESHKSIWTKDDFEQMRWHDSKIYAIAFGINEHEIAIDIDYILEWKNPEEGKTNFKFQVAPATLVFTNVYDLNINFSILNPVIDEISRSNPIKPKNSDSINEAVEYDWVIETTEGEITFKSVGYTQYLRQCPKILDGQSIGLSERGGIAFDKIVT